MKSVEASAKTRQEAIQKALQTLGAELHEVQIEIVDEGSKGLFGLGARDVKVRLTLEGAEEEPAAAPRSRERREERETNGGRRERRDRDGAGRGDRPRRAERPQGSDGGQRQERQPRPERAERPPRPEKAQRPERPPRPERPAKAAVRSEERKASEPEVELVPVTDARREEATALLDEILNKMGIEAKVSSTLADDGRAMLSIESSDSAILIGRKGRNLQSLQYLVNRMMRQTETTESNERFVVDVESYLDRHKSGLEEMALHLAQRAKETGRDVRVKPLSAQDRRIVHLTLQDDPDVRTFSLGNSSIRTVVISPKNASGDNDRPRRGRRGQGRRPRKLTAASATAKVPSESVADMEGDE